MSLTEISAALLEIGEISSKKEKEQALAKHKNNTLMKDVLNIIFNPFIKTNIAKKKLAKKVSVGAELSTVEDYMSFLSKSTGKDTDIGTVQRFIQSQPEEVRWLLEAMAIKTLKFGFTESTINKAFDCPFIPTFDVMLAHKYIDKKRDGKVKKNYAGYVGKDIIATPKLDGNRCVVFVNHDGSVEFFSRSGQLLEGYSELEEAFKSAIKGFVYDGEILAVNDTGMNSKELFQKTQKIVRKKGEKTGVEFHAFDLLTIEEFKDGISKVPCVTRKSALESIINDDLNQRLIKYVEPLYIGVFDEEVINRLSEEASAKEEEGIMVQLANAPYQLKRTYDILKVKVMESADLRVIDLLEGDGQNKGKLGALAVDYKGYKVKVGSGFTPEEREQYWSEPESILGRIVEVQYFTESQDQHGDLSLRFPVFKSIRTDKAEPSYN